MKGVGGTRLACMQPAQPFRGGSIFLSDPKSFGDFFGGEGIEPK